MSREWRSLALSGAAGLAAGIAAQLLRERTGALSILGGGIAVWVTIGLFPVRRTAAAWAGPDRWAWSCVAAAAYLYAWLLAYHALFGVHDHVAFGAVWHEARYWVAAVAPAAIALGLVAVGSLRRDLLGDLCVGAPLGWSLHETYAAASEGWSTALVVGLPTLAAAGLFVAVSGVRGRNVWAIAGSALAVGLAFHLAYPDLIGLG